MKNFCRRLLENNTLAFFTVMVLCVIPIFVSFMLPHTAIDRESAWYPLLAATLSGLGWVAGVIAALITLRHGPERSWVLLPILFVPGVVASLYTHNMDVFLSGVVFKYGLTWVLAWILFATASWSIVIETGCFLGVAGVLLFHYWVGNASQYWMELFSSAPQFFSQSSAFEPEQQAAMLFYLSKVFTGAKACMALVDSLSMILMARWIQSRFFNPGALRQELLDIRCSFVATLAAFIVCTYVYYGYAWAVDAFILVILPVFISGIMLVHSYARTWKYPLLLLVPVYVGFCLNAIITGFFLATVSTIDVVRRFRSNCKKSGPSAT